MPAERHAQYRRVVRQVVPRMVKPKPLCSISQYRCARSRSVSSASPGTFCRLPNLGGRHKTAPLSIYDSVQPSGLRSARRGGAQRIELVPGRGLSFGDTYVRQRRRLVVACCRGVMRKTIFTIVILALVWLGYTAWPLYVIFVLVRAFETRNLETLKQHVYFDSVRRSLSDQIVVAYIRRSGIQLPPLARAVPGAALAIADPVVAKVISPEALSEFLTIGWPVAVEPAVPTGTVGISSKTIGNAWQVYAASEYGLGRFNVIVPQSVVRLQQFGLEFKLLQWRWQLTAITLPEAVLNALADELINAMKKPAR
jgi:hypothetical protein